MLAPPDTGFLQCIPDITGVANGSVSVQEHFKESVVQWKNIAESNCNLFISSREMSKGRYICVCEEADYIFYAKQSIFQIPPPTFASLYIHILVAVP